MEPEVGKYVLFTAREGCHLEKIVKITPTMIRCEYHDLDKITHYVKGRSIWDTTTARLITDEEAQRLKVRWAHQKKARKLKDYDFSELTNEQIDLIYKIIEGGHNG